MRRSLGLALLLMLAGACGRLGFDHRGAASDAGALDAMDAPTLDADPGGCAFGTPELIAPLSSGSNDVGASVTGNELILFYAYFVRRTTMEVVMAQR
jgi:hypothetical protein